MVFFVNTSCVTRMPSTTPIKRQHQCYRQKKKRHTLKGQIVIDTNQRIICVHTSINTVHDFKLFKQSRLPIKKETKVGVDNGYLGIHALHANSELPKKKSKHHQRIN